MCGVEPRVPIGLPRGPSLGSKSLATSPRTGREEVLGLQSWQPIRGVWLRRRGVCSPRPGLAGRGRRVFEPGEGPRGDRSDLLVSTRALRVESLTTSTLLTKHFALSPRRCVTDEPSPFSPNVSSTDHTFGFFFKPFHIAISNRHITTIS